MTRSNDGLGVWLFVALLTCAIAATIEVTRNKKTGSTALILVSAVAIRVAASYKRIILEIAPTLPGFRPDMVWRLSAIWDPISKMMLFLAAVVVFYSWLAGRRNRKRGQENRNDIGFPNKK